MPVISKQFFLDNQIVTCLVEEAEDRMRLDQFVQLCLPFYSRQEIKKKFWPA
ncbi:MAG: hypothetical protein HN353_06425 [Bdellovibrionales bacterium]|nr:hypothetical protein [Bdellovibrionales bacterium]MBT3526269.1 hypothetical protein [Bdellovibrionales bacterium]MBT7766705.1 hypothetical protein [Bdellovibrionales bacterium]